MSTLERMHNDCDGGFCAACEWERQQDDLSERTNDPEAETPAPLTFPQESATPWEAGHTPAGKPAVFAADQSTVCTVHTDSDAHLIAVAVNKHRADIKPADTTISVNDWGY